MNKIAKSSRKAAASETIYFKQIIEGYFKMSAAMLLTAALLISGI